MVKRQAYVIFLFIMIFVFPACLDDHRGATPSDPSAPPSDPETPPADPDPPPSDPEPTTPPPPFSTEALMTAQDVVNSASSNISITNATGASVTGHGLYIAAFDINDCSSCYGSVVSGNNAGGVMVQPVSFSSGQSINVGQNYLYNLIYNGIYFIKTIAGSTPCGLPGCSWPGDAPDVAGWCLSIGVMSLDSSYTSSTYINGAHSPASVVPYGAAVTSNPFGYNYDLIDPSTLGVGNSCLGPIVCDDQTLTCTVSTPQSQSFQSY